MAAKGRHWRSTLTNAQVIEIRNRVAAGEKQCHLAEEFEVRPSTISRMVSRKRRVYV